MKAIAYYQYGTPDVLRLEEMPKPTPKEDEVLIQIYAASVNAADWHLLTADIFAVRLATGFFKPKIRILGADLAGRVAAVGSKVTRFASGDAVFGELSACGWGSFAEYACAPERYLVRKPANLTFEQAAAVPLAAVTAWQALCDKGKVQPGHKVLINGASGGVGTYAVQIAKVFGAEVTGVCSTQKMEMVAALGADHVIDYTREDFTQSGQRYNLILAANGNRSIFDYKRALAPQGVYVMTGGSLKQLMQAALLGRFLSRGGIKMGNLLAKSNGKDLASIAELLEAGKVAPVIDRTYPLQEVPQALREFGAGHTRGKIVITVKNAP